MIWNYRIIKHEKDGYANFAIHEVFYDKNGNVESWTANPIDVSGESKAEVIRVLKMMLKDVDKTPPLVETQLEEALRDKI